MNFWTQPRESLNSLLKRKSPQVRQVRHFYSNALDRDVDIDIYLPPDYQSNTQHKYPLVIFNDGQDLIPAQLSQTLEYLWRKKKIPYIIAVGIHAGPERIREYGTKRQKDYKGRGDKAPQYHNYILEELLPYLFNKFRLSGLTEETAIAGFSLGALSAMDIGWDNPEIFGTVGIFSGALWWRWSEVSPHGPDADRIMHDIVQKTHNPNEKQRFWLQVGTKDEEDDRNNNGVIDAIDDTLDLIRELKLKGYRDESVRYLEIEDGEHNPKTWGYAMSDFLVWTFMDVWRHDD